MMLRSRSRSSSRSSSRLAPRPFVAALVVALIAGGGVAALAQTGGAARPGPAPPLPETRDAQPAPRPGPPSLSTLYERLKAAATPQEAEVLVRQIARRWARSGSDTSDLLMARARQALGAQNGPLAVELLDRLIALHPGWAEAWHARGLAFFMMQDDARALVDFREALRREPGHFMALGMAAAAFQRQGDERNALNAYRALEALNPHFRGAKEAIERLKPSVDGRDA
ncbi:MAG: tetratricopeptide repeat protein [Bosea sp.]|jgi:tetratricopeptide (TPR) repeat protein|nr:tetratricopeptide repeat protein [Bosea sp. (in: a-proteobacteria)]